MSVFMCVVCVSVCAFVLFVLCECASACPPVYMSVCLSRVHLVLIAHHWLFNPFSVEILTILTIIMQKRDGCLNTRSVQHGALEAPHGS